MSLGPGKYDDLCTYVRDQAHARAAIVVVFDGYQGSGFSCQTDIFTLARLPETLEAMARQIRKEREATNSI